MEKMDLATEYYETKDGEKSLVFKSENDVSVDDSKIYPVWFATTRKPINKNDLTNGFSNQRDDDDNIYYGKCNVFIPKSHHFGEVGRSWFSWKRIEEFDFKDSNLKLLKIISYDRVDDFWLDLKKNFSENRGDALVFIHGYNNTFEEAAIRAAQIGVDLEVSGATAFFSWASKGNFIGYPDDEASIESSETELTAFLLDFVQKSGASKVHIIAHSMGNRGLLRALENIHIKLKDSKILFGQIILAAPDIDVKLFKNLAYLYPLLSKQTTLYVSPKDVAITTSKFLHNYQRAGIAPPVTIVNGIQTVEVDKFNLFHLLGHGYYAEAESVLHDMFNLIRGNSRQELKIAQTKDGKKYWVIH